MKQNNSTKLLGYAFRNTYYRYGTPDPLDPKSAFCPDFIKFSIENRPFFGQPASEAARQPTLRLCLVAGGVHSAVARRRAPKTIAFDVYGRRTPFGHSCRQSGKNADFGSRIVFLEWGGLHIVNSRKIIARKLRIIIPLHFGLVTFKINFRKTIKPFISIVFGPTEGDHLETNIIHLWRHQDPPNNSRKSRFFSK